MRDYEAELGKREQELGPDHVEVLPPACASACAASAASEGTALCARAAWDPRRGPLPRMRRAGLAESRGGSMLRRQPGAVLRVPHGQGAAQIAEGLSNLAIMYNQQGEYGKAQPLYERALGIWEAAYGPNHPDVAHTLTDLAVLHLEQARPQQAPTRCLRCPMHAPGWHMLPPQAGARSCAQCPAGQRATCLCLGG